MGLQCAQRPMRDHLMVPVPSEKDIEHLSLKEQEIIRTGDRINKYWSTSTAREPSVRNMGMNEGPPPLCSVVSHPSPNPTLFSTCSISAQLIFQIQNQYCHTL